MKKPSEKQQQKTKTKQTNKKINKTKQNKHLLMSCAKNAIE